MPDQIAKLRKYFSIILLFIVITIAISLYVDFSDYKLKYKGHDMVVYHQRGSAQFVRRIQLVTIKDSQSELSFVICDPDDEDQFYLPKTKPFPYNKDQMKEEPQYRYSMQSADQNFIIQQNQSTVLTIKHISITKQYTQFTIEFNSNQIYGMGDYFKQVQNMTLWPSDNIGNYTNPIGYHPFIFIITNYLTNNSQQIRQFNVFITQYGGEACLKIFIGNKDPESIITQYHKYLNGYRVYNLKDLGLQLYIDGKVNLSNIIKQFDEDLSFKPLSAVWFDQSYYSDINDINDNLNLTQDQFQLMTFTSPIVEKNKIHKDYLIKSSYSDKPLVGCKNGKLVNYLDYNNKRTLTQLEDGLPIFEGFEIRDNQILNDISGETLNDNCKYHRNIQQFEQNTLSLDSIARNHLKNNLIITQSLQYRYFKPINYLLQQDQYQSYFLLSHSTMYGSGQFTGHMNLNINLTQAISKQIQYSLLGIPYVGHLGVDCSKVSLLECAQWLSLQTWSPIIRLQASLNLDKIDKDFVDFVKKQAKLRFRLQKWIFTQLVIRYDKQIGAAVGSLIQPLWWFEPNDPIAIQYEEREFIFAETFLVSPVDQFYVDSDGKHEIEVYFPSTNKWFLENGQAWFRKGKSRVQFDPMFVVTHFQKEGTIVQMQEFGDKENEFYLQVVLNDKSEAVGKILLLENYGEQNVYNQCYQEVDCVAQLEIQQVQKELNNYQFMLKVQQSRNTRFQNVYIYRIQINHTIQRSNQIFSLTQPLLLKPNLEIILNDLI
ncbi:hypothetical protein pb186bvf_015001 [Paramecium bursaria]